jgi:radical SAM protein with 4Fe4S-binding SPASM domain
MSIRAKRIDGQTPGGKRAILADLLPLDTPLLVQIFPAYACNFRCRYCIHSVPLDQRGFVAGEKIIDFDLYRKCIDDLAEFPQKVKMLRFAATGEPLLHPEIAEMVSYAKAQNIAHSIDIVTNGSLLTEALSLQLINAGLDQLRISVQGLSSKAYFDVAQVKFNFEELVKKVRFFYNNRQTTKIYVKIIDIDLSEREKRLFLTTFGNISDTIAIEQLTPAVPRIDYSKLTEKSLSHAKHGKGDVPEGEVCPQPFYLLQVNPDGNVTHCCSMETAFVTGNCRSEKLLDIWQGKKLLGIQRLQLFKKKWKNRVCASCEEYKYAMLPEDLLDLQAKDLLKKY